MVDRDQLLAGDDLLAGLVIIVEAFVVDGQLFQGMILRVGFGDRPDRVPVAQVGPGAGRVALEFAGRRIVDDRNPAAAAFALQELAMREAPLSEGP